MRIGVGSHGDGLHAHADSFRHGRLRRSSYVTGASGGPHAGPQQSMRSVWIFLVCTAPLARS